MKAALRLQVGHMQKFTPSVALAKQLVRQLSTPLLSPAHTLVELAPAPKPLLTQAFNVLLWELLTPTRKLLALASALYVLLVLKWNWEYLRAKCTHSSFPTFITALLACRL
jgi:hypothetical protein